MHVMLNDCADLQALIDIGCVMRNFFHECIKCTKIVYLEKRNMYQKLCQEMINFFVWKLNGESTYL